jgi:TRAP-type C4-dicarboxylate transport system permease small subunit
LLAVEGADMVAFSRMVDLKSNGYLEVPMWMPQILVPIGAVLMGLAALVAFVAAWRAGPRATVPTSQATGIE